MARHRNVRSMNYSDEYDGYDDVYGHSVEDDYCVSPSEAAFMYNRESSKNQQIGAFIKDIAEEDELENKLPDNESAELESCIAKMKTMLGDIASEQEITKVLLDNNLNINKAVVILVDANSAQSKQPEKKEKDDKLLPKPTKQFNIPKLNSFKIKNSPFGPSNEIKNSLLKLNTKNDSPKTFSSLSDLSSNHLRNVKGSCSIPNLKVKIVTDNSLTSLTHPNTDKGQVVKCDLTTFSSNNDSNIDNKESNSVQIDLTKALIKNTTQKSITGLSKKFNYLDISAEKEVRNDFNCTMDITFILNTTSSVSKKVSSFGKIVCRRYRKFVPVIVNDKQSCKFSFHGPSPDDLILRYLS